MARRSERKERMKAMKSKILMVCAAALLLLSATTATWALQLLANPGFENGTPRWNGDSCGGEATVESWTYSSINPFSPPDPQLCMGFWHGGETAWVGGTRVHEGAASVRAFSYGYTAGFWHGSIRQTADVVPGQSYTGSAWIYVYHDWVTYPTVAPQYFLRLDIQELDSADAPVGAPHSVVYDNSEAYTNTWLNPTTTFTTSGTTAKVEFKLSMYTDDPYFKTHLNFDDCQLNGPSPNSKFVQGTVTSGATPIVGATVQIGAASAVTGTGGTYSIELAGTTTDATIRASGTGYFPAKKHRALASQITEVNFDLTAVGANLLTNPGFEDNASLTAYTTVSNSWSVQPAIDHYVRESFFFDNSYPYYFHKGEMAAGLLSDTPPEEIITFQTVSVLPNSAYVAKAWARASAEGWSWYAGSDQKAALFVQQLDKAGQLLDERKEFLTDFGDWQQLSCSFTTLPSTAMVRVGGWANMIDDYGDTLARAVFDDFELNGAAGPGVPGAFGLVTSGGVPLAGAKVELPYAAPTYRSDITDQGGAWAIYPPFPGGYYVRALKPGYYTQKFLRTLPSAAAINYDLVEKGNNLLVNPGFDDEAYAGGWESETSGDAPSYRRGEYRFITGETGLPWYAASGEEAMALFTAYSTAGGGHWYYQSVPVIGGASYTARVKTRISMAAGASSQWGNTFDTQVAGLLIKEYNSSGTLVLAHDLVASSELPDWETLESVFQAQPTTTTIKVGPYVWMEEDASANWWWPRATFDDVELRGPLGNAGLSGTVKSGATPIVGAVVTVTEQDGGTAIYTTNSSGQYVVSISYGSTYTVKVSKAGYYPQTKSTTVTGQQVLDFDLYPVNANLVQNPGFDSEYGYLFGGWVAAGFYNGETQAAQFGPGHYFTVPQAFYMRGPGIASRVQQDVPVLPNSSYAASCYFMPATDSRYGSVWGSNPSQVGALSVYELSATKQIIGAEQRQYGDPASMTWQKLSLDVNTSADTAYIRIGGYGYLVDNFDANLARAIFDQFELVGPVVPGISIAQAKAAADSTAVRVLGRIVTAKFGTYFYIEEADRSCGIQVWGDANVGDVVDVIGTVSTVNGEKVITNAYTVQRSATTPLAPLGMVNRSMWEGLSSTGLYVKVWGTVDAVGADYFTLTDGSGRLLKVYGTATAGTYVCVTGAAGAEIAAGETIPVVRSTSVAVTTP